VSQAAGTEITIEVAPAAVGELAPDQAAALPAGAVLYSISVYSRGVYIHAFDGEILATLPYGGRLPAGVWHIGGDGPPEKIPCEHDALAGAVAFRLPHMSHFAVGYAGAAAWANPFTDVSESDWFYGDVEYAVTSGLCRGTSATAFEPNAPVTRAMFATMLHRLAGSPAAPAGGAAFGDADAGAWYGAAVGWAAGIGLARGVGGGLFEPDSAISRQDMATLLHRHAALASGGALGADGAYGAGSAGDADSVDDADGAGNVDGVHSAGGADGADDAGGAEGSRLAAGLPFSDAADVADYAAEAVAWAAGEGIANGRPGNLFDPRGAATRAEAAAMLRRHIEAAARRS
jgi:hypothetical protein